MNTTPQQQKILDWSGTKLAVVAGPGSGKTATLVEKIKLLSPDDLPKTAVITFTIAAAAELKSRLGETKVGFVGTLHSWCARILRAHGSKIIDPAFVVISQFDADVVLDRVHADSSKKIGKGEIEDRIDWGKFVTGKFTGGDAADDLAGVYMSRLITTRRIDYDALLHLALSLLTDLNPPREEILFVDEVQDSSVIDWKIYEAWKPRVMVAIGDTDQCQPPGTLVRLQDGITSAPIESLSVGEKILTYARHEKCLLKNGVVGAVSGRPYSGVMLTVSAGGKASDCTPNHKWLVKILSGANRTALIWCTYIMRKGDHFRVGKTRMFRSGGGPDKTTGHVLGVCLRMKQEKAEAVWILKTHYSERDAFIHESIVAAKYGLSDACFVSFAGSPHFTSDALDEIFNGIPNQLRKAAICLQDHGRELGHPLVASTDKRTRRTVMEIRACNLIDDVMMVPVAPDELLQSNRGCQWTPVKVTRRHYDGMVYSLDVPTHHKYVSDGLVTCNSIYEFRGATPEMFHALMGTDGVDTLKLEKNFRSDRAICAAANGLMKLGKDRVSKRTSAVSKKNGRFSLSTYSDREEMKSLIVAWAKARDEAKESWAVLCRTNRDVQSIRSALKDAKVETDDSPTFGPVNHLSVFLDVVADPENDTSARRALTVFRGDIPAVEVTKLDIEARSTGVAMSSLIGKLIPDLDYAPFIKHHPLDLVIWKPIIDAGRIPELANLEKIIATLEPTATVQELAAAVVQFDREAPTSPRTVRTIHKAKGLEWDAVLIPGIDEGEFPPSDPDRLEESRRLLFVGVTRAKHHFAGYSDISKPSRFTEEMLS